ncbi:MAG TPA: hypothetical protein VN723_08145 [Rhizomicrobium sp.]|jgi:hypothetical protein|nr:hypothetical protein [Rhizomicrobium sp.]
MTRDKTKSKAPAAPRHTGPWNEYADATGIDSKYAEEQAEAERQLKQATAGPEAVNPRGAGVAIGDTEMKNPHGAFASPAPHAGPHRQTDPGADGQSNRKPGGSVDPEGRQGGAIPGEKHRT